MFEFIPRFFKRRFGVDKEYFRFIDEMFGFVPHNIDLYKVALIHKSASQSIGGHSINNERLEYLGDAIIESITSDYLFIEFPDCNEGFLTQMRSKLVSRQSLNEIARKIGLDRYVIYNMNGNLAHKHIYGDAFEAMIGAIYLDQGYEFVNRLLINIYAQCMNLEELTESECDFKSRLIEWCQKNHHKVAFRTRTVNARRSAPTFYTTVLIDGIEVGHGSGDSKKEAEQSAANSVSHQMSDEECADLLDKFDNLHSKIANGNSDGEQSENGEQHSRSSRSRRRRRRRSAAENVENSDVQQPDTATAAEPNKEAKDDRRTAKKQSAADSKTAAEQKTTAEQTAEEKPKRTRTPRRRKSADNASAVGEAVTEVAAQTPADEAATEKKTARRKRGTKQTEANAETVAADMQQSASGKAKVATVSEPAAAEVAAKVPAKSRRTAKPKAEPSVNAEEKPRRTRATKAAAEKTDETATTAKATRTAKKTKATATKKTAAKAEDSTAKATSAKAATVKNATATTAKTAAKASSAAAKAKTANTKAAKTAKPEAKADAASNTAKDAATTSDAAQSEEKRTTRRRTRKE